LLQNLELNTVLRAVKQIFLHAPYNLGNILEKYGTGMSGIFIPLFLGDYQCVVENRYGATYSAKAKITVYVFPRSDFAVISFFQSFGLFEASLTFPATGDPDREYLWLF
jgi:hypothetical protein